jgi:hypothetical protein
VTTAYDIITGALRKIGQYTVGETLQAEDATTGMEQLNALLDMLSNEHLAIYDNVETILTFVAGQSTYTIGPGGDFNVDRPLRISGAYTRLQPTGTTVDYPCVEVDFTRYAAIGLKSQPGPWPKMMYYDGAYPLGQLFFWPVPSQSAEFHLWVDMLFAGFADLTDSVSMPPGYVLMLQTNLAVMLAPEYGVEPSPQLLEQARRAKAAIKSTNAKPQALSVYEGVLSGSNNNDAGWILHGGF